MSSTYEKFNKLPIGGVMGINVHELTCSQPDDGDRRTASNRPIEAYPSRGQIIVLNGNHRCWDLISRGEGNRKLQVRRAIDPEYV